MVTDNHAADGRRDGGGSLGLDTRGVVATEFTGDESTPAGAIAIFELADGLLLALYPRTELAKDANISIRYLSVMVVNQDHFITGSFMTRASTT